MKAQSAQHDIQRSRQPTLEAFFFTTCSKTTMAPRSSPLASSSSSSGPAAPCEPLPSRPFHSDGDGNEDVPLAVFLGEPAGTQREAVEGNSINTATFASEVTAAWEVHARRASAASHDFSAFLAAAANDPSSQPSITNCQSDLLSCPSRERSTEVNSPSSVPLLSPAPPPSLPRTLTQTTLDLGQRGSALIGQRCPRCHMLFNLNAEDVAVHDRYCRAQRRRQHRTEKGEKGGSDKNGPGSSDAQYNNDVSADVLAGRKAVELLEVLSGATVGALPQETSHSFLSTTRAHVGRTAARGSAGRKRARKSLAPVSLSDMSFSCIRVPSGLSSAGLAATTTTQEWPPSPLHPLEIFVLTYRGIRSSDAVPRGSLKWELESGSGSLVQLLNIVGFTQHLWTLLHTHNSNKHTSSNDDISAGGTAAAATTTTFVFVVDATLRLLVSAVAGHATKREHDPELWVQRRPDGSVLCGTRRVFSLGDVWDVWVTPAAVLSRAQRAWEEKAAAPYVSARDVLNRFFKVSRTTSAAPTATSNMGQDVSSCETFRIGSNEAAKQHRHRQLAVGVALQTLARHLNYGQALCPFSQLSYATSVLRKSGEEMGAATSEATSEGGFSADTTSTDAWLIDCLRVGAPLCAASERRRTTSLVADAAGEDFDGVLLCHADTEDSGSESERDEETRKTGGAFHTTRRRHISFSRGAKLQEEGNDDGDDANGDRLSVVSYSSDS